MIPSGAQFDEQCQRTLDEVAKWVSCEPSELEFADFGRVIRMKGTRVDVAHMDFDQDRYVKVINAAAPAQS